MTAIIEFEGVSKSFDVGARRVQALADLDLTIDAGELFAIVGHSGAGKSTLVRLINGLERIDSGRLVVDGVDISTIPERELRILRRRTGMIFQQFNLFASRTVAGNVGYPLRAAGWPKERREKRIAELLDFVGLLDRAHSYPDQLSGGQKQRVGIARALATSPKILLADESTSALDPETTQDILHLLRSVNRDFGTTVVVITHEMDVVREVADRVAVLGSGRVVELGTVFDVFAKPESAVTRSFVSTALHDRADGAEFERLRAAHAGRIVVADVVDNRRIGAVLSGAARHGVTFEILYGAITALQHRSFGSLTLELIGDDAGVDAVIRELRTATNVEEISA